MAQINNTKEPPQFNGSNYPYWKAEMTTYIKSINRNMWKVVEIKIEIADLETPTAVEEVWFSKTIILLLVPFMMHWMREHLSKSRTLK
jgi:hypothetical protein